MKIDKINICIYLQNNIQIKLIKKSEAMKKFFLQVILSIIFFSSTYSHTQQLNLNLTKEYSSNIIPELTSFSDFGKNIITDSEQKKSPIEANFDQALDFCKAAQDFWQEGELDNALLTLDQAYSLILNVNDLNLPKLIQQKEDLRFMISKRILEIYASRNIVVNGNHNAIPIILNKQVKREIRKFTTVEKRFFIQSYKRSGRFRPMILAALKEAGLPSELSWLPLVESGFKLRALSSARALGLWQFMASTGYMYGLKRNQFIDERLDPEKSTKAAIAYLKMMHGMFGDWSTVLAAYNCGPSRTLRIIRSQNINYLDNFWDLYGRLPRETSRYVPRFLATLHIINNLKKYNMENIELDSPDDFETVTVSRQIHLRDIAQKVNTTENVLRDLNPELRYKILPQESYKLRVPADKAETLLAVINTIKTSRPPQKAYIYHRVKFGESLSTIARKYHVSIRTISRANKISKKSYIVTGKILKIPQRGSYKYAARKKNINKNATKHKVRRGDSLWIIAKRYGTTTRKIKQINRLSSNNLYIGQTLSLPGNKKKHKPGKNATVYQVKNGDSPFTIASEHNMNLERLLNINQLTSRSKIFPGQRLYIE